MRLFIYLFITKHFNGNWKQENNISTIHKIQDKLIKIGEEERKFCFLCDPISGDMQPVVLIETSLEKYRK